MIVKVSNRPERNESRKERRELRAQKHNATKQLANILLRAQFNGDRLTDKQASLAFVFAPNRT
jgi:hypothetical protein